MKHFRIFALVFLAFLVATTGCKKEDLVDTTQNELIDITSESQFNEGVKSGVSLIFYHASWCSKCAEQRPAVEAISVRPDFGNVFFAEVEYEDHKGIVQGQNIAGFPTIVIYKDGVEQKKFAGKGHSQGEIETALRQALN
ncbi:MAG: thiol-disulfide isomerase/thioredoxin [Bacteroidia bacterium]|jgi:thiol-disulfide isomerase/thioredoxin